jgi:hypothetical protein
VNSEREKRVKCKTDKAQSKENQVKHDLLIIQVIVCILRNYHPLLIYNI